MTSISTPAELVEKWRKEAARARDAANRAGRRGDLEAQMNWLDLEQDTRALADELAASLAAHGRLDGRLATVWRNRFIGERTEYLRATAPGISYEMARALAEELAIKFDSAITAALSQQQGEAGSAGTRC